MMMIVLLTMSAQAQQVKYTVKGVSKDNGKMVYLEDRLTSTQVDSTIIAKGKFSFKGQADKDAILAVTIYKDNWREWHTLFFNDGKPVSVNMNDSTLKGSPLNERLSYYNIQILGNPSSYYPERKAAMVKLLFDEESETLLPAPFIVEYQRCNGTEGLLNLAKEKHAYSEHPLVQNIVNFWKSMSNQTIVVKSKKTQAQKDAAKEEKDAFVSHQYIDFEMFDPQGNTHKQSEYVGKGRWLFVDFWASWCGPCLREMPNVVAAYEKFHAKGLDIVGVSLDGNKEPWVKSITQQNLSWSQLSDLKSWESEVTKLYKIDAIPDNLLIDPQGNIVARGLRKEALRNKLEEIFSNSAFLSPSPQ